MILRESSEDYLERILMLELANGKVKSIDIANDMDFSKPSVSIAMKKLKESNYISIDENGYIHLTVEGRKIASSVYERHLVLTEALMLLGVKEEIAKIDACKIEHDLSKESYECIKSHLKQQKNKNL